MFSLERCRQIVGYNCGLDDEKLIKLRDQLYGLADVLTDQLRIQRQINNLRDLQTSETNAYESALRLLPESEREDVEERAAILEFDGGINREGAERKAILGVLEIRNQKKDWN